MVNATKRYCSKGSPFTRTASQSICNYSQRWAALAPCLVVFGASVNCVSKIEQDTWLWFSNQRTLRKLTASELCQSVQDEVAISFWRCTFRQAADERRHHIILLRCPSTTHGQNRLLYFRLRWLVGQNYAWAGNNFIIIFIMVGVMYGRINANIDVGNHICSLGMYHKATWLVTCSTGW